jgi:hypothetical protein
MRMKRLKRYNGIRKYKRMRNNSGLNKIKNEENEEKCVKNLMMNLYDFKKRNNYENHS